MDAEYIDRDARLVEIDKLLEETQEQLRIQVREGTKKVLRGRLQGIEWCRKLILEAPAVDVVEGKKSKKAAAGKSGKKSEKKDKPRKRTRKKSKPSLNICLIQDCSKSNNGCCHECKIENCKNRCANTPDKCGCSDVRRKK